ncbi:unnamed protein product [Paramecium sonneborni]|uniref:Transmembrane protein n=1 Tax=Paramecium sonneborni TaxID=65129 RepID=A0A8S1RNL6_9CILI|nr:unnamed protein product [Paramecium sonneborni]
MFLKYYSMDNFTIILVILENLQQNHVYEQISKTIQINNTSTFFPRAFDLGNAINREDFLKEYERTAVTIILKKAISVLRINWKSEIKKIKERIFEEWKMKEVNKKIRRINMKRTVKRKYKNIYTAQELEDQQQVSEIKFDCSIMSEVFSRLSGMKRYLKDGIYDDKIFELSHQYISKTRLNLIAYSYVQKFDKGSNPSQFLIRKLYRYHLFLKKYLTKLMEQIIFGLQNLVIVQEESKLYKYKKIQRWWKSLYRKRIKQSAKINSFFKWYIYYNLLQKKIQKNNSLLLYLFSNDSVPKCVQFHEIDLYFIMKFLILSIPFYFVYFQHQLINYTFRI